MSNIFETIEPCEVCSQKNKWVADGFDQDDHGRRRDFYHCKGEYQIGEWTEPCDNRAWMSGTNFEQVFCKPKEDII